MECYLDTRRGVCEDKEECEEKGGECSDLNLDSLVVSLPPRESLYGACYTTGAAYSSAELTSPIFDSRNEFFPTCSAEEEDRVAGCYKDAIYTKEDCKEYGAEEEGRKGVWIEPSKNEKECLAKKGCWVPHEKDVFERKLWFRDEEACDCYGGITEEIFSWTPGVWVGGKAIPLNWVPETVKPDYEWKESLSLVKIEDWVRGAAERSFGFLLKSQLICDTNYLSSSLSSVVCDCYSDEDIGVEGISGECFADNPETQINYGLVCAGEKLHIKGPSNFINFEVDSISDLCTEVSVYLIQGSWYRYATRPVTATFEFAEITPKGTVLNSNGATVGEVVGNGGRVEFEYPKRVRSMRTCLLVSDLLADPKYPVHDMAVIFPGKGYLSPLGIEDDLEEIVQDSRMFWCLNVTQKFDESLPLFPIIRSEDYEDDDDGLSHQTKSLVYTLAACYCFDLFLLLLYLGVTLQNYLKNKGILPLVSWLGVIFAVLCVFRIAFCFVYLDDQFEDNELSYFVLFEIPTFLLMSGIILVIGLFLKLSNAEDSKSRPFVAVALGVIWSIFVVVVVVYSEVLLNDEDETVCEGRIQSDNSEQEDNIRTFMIAYQSTVIALIIGFALLFLVVARSVLSSTVRSSPLSRSIFRLVVALVSAFILRSILFLILLIVDFTSDIYLFITLMITEVFLAFFISIEYNQAFYGKLIQNVSVTHNSSTHQSGIQLAGSTHDLR
uniref:Uncharacterized protein n=1 Tax=Paramoeba aestuarina TaxID=180227 RepID=A0A7S4NP18_9EUKA